ncbi:MAG: response regulator [Gammaproteobacteria bacterium]|nr:response regulator [Gammaproteobacteria bacterium]
MSDVNKEQSKLKILLVDDESANILLLTKMLSIKGYDNVISTVDSRDVISLHQKHNFDLILLDINMPEMDGYEVINELKNIDGFSNINVVAISGDIEPCDIQKGLDSGFTAYLTKPMRIQTLMEVTDKALQQAYK